MSYVNVEMQIRNIFPTAIASAEPRLGAGTLGVAEGPLGWEDHRMHMLIVALDYKRTGRPLDCVTHARNVEELARRAAPASWETRLV